MDITNRLSATEIRARIFSSKSRLRELKDKRKRHYAEINKAKRLFRSIESSIDRGCIDELSSLDSDSIRTYLLYLRHSISYLEELWRHEVVYCRNLHKKIDNLGERVYL